MTSTLALHPDGATCADCRHISRCSWLISYSGKETSCDWDPSRFDAAPKRYTVTSRDRKLGARMTREQAERIADEWVRRGLAWVTVVDDVGGSWPRAETFKEKP